jgi:hypothetical protein
MTKMTREMAAEVAAEVAVVSSPLQPGCRKTEHEPIGIHAPVKLWDNRPCRNQENA